MSAGDRRAEKRSAFRRSWLGWRNALRFSALQLILLLAVSPVLAQVASPPNASPRAALHEGFGRMVFDWDGPVGYSADVINGELVVRFERPVKGDFRTLARPLSRYVSGVSVSADRTTASFPLTRPVQVKASAGRNHAVIIDLVDAPEAGASPAPGDPGGPTSLLPPAGGAPSAVPPPPAAPRPAASEGSLPAVDVRAGEHGAYNRLVFDWPAPVGYKVQTAAGKATITFARAGRLGMAAAQASLPGDISVQSTDSGAKSTTLVLSIPPKARLRHFASGSKVVVDVVRDAAAEPPPAPAAPSGGAAAPEVAQPTLKPLVPEQKPTLPSETLAATAPPPSGPSPLKPTGRKPPPAQPAASRPADKAPSPPPPEAAPRPAVTTGKVFSLSVPWEKPAAAAVFRRAGYLWLVFDRPQDVDTTLLRRLGGEAVSRVEQLPSKEGTVLRLLIQPEYVPSVRREGLLWVVDLMEQPEPPREIIGITAPATLPSGTGIALRVADAGTVVKVTDPEVGDMLQVVPVLPVGAGVYPGRDTPDLELLPTAQGVALIPHLDGLEISSSRTGIAIGRPGSGLHLSSESAQRVETAKQRNDGVIFDVPAWKRGGPETFPKDRRIVEDGMVGLAQPQRSAAHLDAARFFFANGYAPEALGYLRLAADDDPALADSAAFKALRGASQVLMERWDLAVPDLDSPQLAADPQAQFWRAVAHVGGSSEPGREDKAIAAGLAVVKDYPPQLSWPLATLAATSAIAAADDATAQAALTLLDRMTPSGRQNDGLNYLHGVYEEMAGRYQKALDYYQRAADGEDRENHARGVLAFTELQLKLNRLTPQEAIKRLDRLRFAWREEDFEFSLLKRLAELQLKAGDYPSALRALRSLAGNFPGNRRIGEVSKLMSDSFAKLYLEGVADNMSPVSAIGLYDEFRDLTPTGAKGDEMIRKLADRLASVDLLDRAAELLKHQVTYRLQGLDKVRVGAQLALLDLLNRQPREALEALQASDQDGAPADLQRQRRQMKARALADLNRVPEAVQQLVGDNSPEAAQLRAEIYWSKQDWPNAAAVFETMVPRPDRGATLEDSAARLVMGWATALVLSNDERGLASLRRNFAPAMAGTPYNDGFVLLTSAIDRDIPDMPAVAAKIKEAEGFRSFMGEYKKRIKAGGLSRIN